MGLGPNEPRRIHPEPPTRLTPIDVVFLTEVEVRAALVHLSGNPDPVVREALIEAVRRVLDRTRA